MNDPIETHRVCKVCSVEKPIEKFELARSKQGQRLYYRIRTCQLCRTQRYKKLHPEAKTRELSRLRSWKKIHLGTIEGFIYGNLYRWRRRNKKYSIQEPGLTYDFLLKLWEEQKGCCYYSGLNLNKFKQGKDFCGTQVLLYAPSLDRVDSSKGYIQGNVVWCSNFVNCMKVDLSRDEFINLCKAVAKLHP